MDRADIQAFDLAHAGDEWCVFSSPDGRGATVGVGPLRRCESPPADGAAFYVNDFGLSYDRPWLVPEKILRNVRLDGADALAELEWVDPAPEPFAGVFGEIMRSISSGELEKSVPVVTERAPTNRVAELARAVVRRSTHRPPPYYGYGASMVEDGAVSGFAGATPELLVAMRKGRLHTMALAGTAAQEDRDIFAADLKEIREHEYVVSRIERQLEDVGMVRPGSRKVMDLGSIVHFHTPLYVELYRNLEPATVVEAMHPTPALGPLPRTQKTLAQLIEWRDRLGCPRYFGAPFGLWDNGHFHCVVAIRGVHWARGELALPSGCGVIEESRLLNEWRELRLKREAVKAGCGL